VGIGVHQFVQKIEDGRDTSEIMERFDGRRAKDTRYLTEPLVLGGLESFYEPLLVDSRIPYLGINTYRIS
jgi:hypothetical protein